MRMKEDAMGNGQLKPAYNLQHGVDSEYITWLTIGPQPTNTTTLIPFLKDAQEHLKFKYKNITADAVYESEENYLFLEQRKEDLERILSEEGILFRTNRSIQAEGSFGALK